MIICTTDSLDEHIGKVVHNGSLTDANGKYQTIPFFVIRKATRAEYISYCHEWSNKPFTIREDYIYYEISVD